MKNLGRQLLFTVLCGSLSLMAGAPKELSNAVISSDLSAVVAQLQATPEQLNAIDKWGWTPLLWATYEQYQPIVQYLLDKGADPNIPATKVYGNMTVGMTPLIICGYYGKPEMAKLLLAKKADPGKLDSKGMTALAYATQFQDVGAEFVEMKKLLSAAKN